MSEYAEVIIDLVSHAVDRPFHYRVPGHLQQQLKPGQQVTVPLGKRRCQGYVLRLLNHTSIEKLKDIISITDKDPLLTPEQLALLHWISLHYYCRRIDALHAMIPASFRREKRPNRLKVVELTPQALAADLKRAPAQKKALDILQEHGELARQKMLQLGIKAETLRALEKKGLICYKLVPYALQDSPVNQKTTEPHLMQNEQEICFSRISHALKQKKAQRILLHGVTASGKTEVYMQSIAMTLEMGKSSLVLVPEISLTPQMIEHFEGRFPGRVAVLHSRLSVAEKNRQWSAILSEEAKVVLGARSAVFAPLKSIGLIIIDEEHETTYKQEETPRYHARDVAWWRARYNKAVLLLGSATPSLESYYLAARGKAELLSMKERVTPIQLPPVEVVDMRKELKENHRHIFSRPLLEGLDRVLEKEEQALLFINRRGFAGFVLCRECGHVVRCRSCDVSLTLHKDRNIMCCHYCAYEEAVPQVCPGCGGIKIRHFSAGTQRVEEEVKKLYPNVSLIRMDRDTTASRSAHDYYYRQFKARKASILVGTQMIAKGFDFPGVTLVGVVAADTVLNLPDFRAPERTFQLLTQVSGRTARGPLGGKVIVQTYHPGHYSIFAAAKHDYPAFYDQEIENRRQLSYPPFSELLRILFTFNEEKAVFQAAEWFARRLEPIAGELDILGPAPASLYRIKDQFRVQIIIKGEKLSKLAPQVKKLIREYHGMKPAWPVRLAVDFNPQVVL